MAITKRVQSELVEATPLITSAAKSSSARRQKRALLREAATRSPIKLTKKQRESIAARSKGKAWSEAEHNRFLDALELFPAGPWKVIADYIGTKNPRQTMTHAQKYREKHERHQRGLRTKARKQTQSTIKESARQSSKRQRPQPPIRKSRRLLTTGGDHDPTQTSAVPSDAYHQSDHGEQASLDPTDTASDGCRRGLNQEKIEVHNHNCMADVPTNSSPHSDFPLPHVYLPSVDLWASQPSLLLTEMMLCEQEDNITDLEDLHDFATGFSQEGW